MLSILLRFTDCNYPFGYFKLFFLFPLVSFIVKTIVTRHYVLINSELQRCICVLLACKLDTEYYSFFNFMTILYLVLESTEQKRFETSPPPQPVSSLLFHYFCCSGRKCTFYMCYKFSFILFILFFCVAKLKLQHSTQL